MQLQRIGLLWLSIMLIISVKGCIALASVTSPERFGNDNNVATRRDVRELVCLWIRVTTQTYAILTVVCFANFVTCWKVHDMNFHSPAWRIFAPDFIAYFFVHEKKCVYKLKWDISFLFLNISLLRVIVTEKKEVNYDYQLWIIWNSSDNINYIIGLQSFNNLDLIYFEIAKLFIQLLIINCNLNSNWILTFCIDCIGSGVELLFLPTINALVC